MKLGERYEVWGYIYWARTYRQHGMPVYQLVRQAPKGPIEVLRTSLSEAGVLTMLSQELRKRGYKYEVR